MGAGTMEKEREGRFKSTGMGRVRRTPSNTVRREGNVELRISVGERIGSKEVRPKPGQ